MKSIHRIKLYGACLCVILGLTTARDGLLQAVQAESPQLLMGKMSAEDFFNRGVEKFQQQDYEGAIEDFTQALRLNPNLAEAYYYRGRAVHENPRTTRWVVEKNPVDNLVPIDNFTRAIELNPNFMEAYFQRGLAYFELEEYPRAIEDFNQALFRLNLNLDEAYDYRTLAYLELKECRRGIEAIEAIEDITQVLQLDLNNAEDYYLMTVIRYDLEYKQGEIDDYIQAIRISAYREWERIRSDLGDKQGAIDNYTQVIRINPDGTYAYRERGRIRSELGDKQGAIDDYTQVIRINPNDTCAYRERGRIRSDLGDAKGAEEDYNRANQGIRSGRDTPSSQNATGSRSLSSRSEEAETLYRQALDLIQRGDKTGALPLLQQAASLFEANYLEWSLFVGSQRGRNRAQEVRQIIKKLQQQQSPPRPLQTSP